MLIQIAINLNFWVKRKLGAVSQQSRECRVGGIQREDRRKCKGLPLAIVVLGGLLSLKDLTRDSWLKVLKSMDWHLSQEIKASELIRLWVAEGFVQKRGKETLEDIAEDYLYELIQRSMIQVADTRDDGRVKSCRIHDLLRDLAISEAKEEKLFEVDENIDVDVLPTSVRRLIAQLTGLQKLKLVTDNFIESEGLSTSTTILFPGLESFSHHKCLYKLHLVGPIRKLPVETTLYPPNLMQLKLYRTILEEDPMPILERLPNLRILILLLDSYKGTGMNCPPGGFLRLEFLQMQEKEQCLIKTLKIEFCRKVRKFPDGLLQLKKLQRLNLYEVSQELMSEVLETQGEDWNRIRRIISQKPTW
ncbi:hypothetical protein AAG906_015422 [Vitis piasezkii]